jgi:hypothetical protein
MLMPTKTAAREAKTAKPCTAPRKPAPAPARAANAKALLKRSAKAKSAARIRPPAAPTPHQPPGTNKQSRLIALLGAAPGATLEQMMKLTGWQAHSVRGVISGVLRKRLNLNVTCTPDPAGGARIYRVEEVA